MTTTEVFHIFTSSNPNLLIKWRSTSSFPIVFNHETREFLRGSENSFRPFYSVEQSGWKALKSLILQHYEQSELCILSYYWRKNSNETFLVIFKVCAPYKETTQNMTERRDVFVWLGYISVLFTLHIIFDPKAFVHKVTTEEDVKMCPITSLHYILLMLTISKVWSL